MSDPAIRRAAAVDLAVRREPLVLAETTRAAVDRRWAAASAGNPHLWNGPFYLFDRVAQDEEDGGRFTASAATTDFATFLHWREQGLDGLGLAHIFPVGAVVTEDRRLMLGRMGPRTANAGKCYPPSGSFDPGDLVDGRLQPFANALREIREEVGIDADDFPADPDWLVIPSGPHRHALVRVIRAPARAAELETVAAAHIAASAEEELSGVRFVALDETLDPAETVPYVLTLLAWLDRHA